MSDTNDMRREFEQHIRDSIVSECGEERALKTDDEGYYLTSWVNNRWVDWQAATERATASQWQDIATAPKDGTRFLLVIDHGEYGDKIWTGLWADGWMVSYGKPQNTPTHWMPLPPPPAIRQGGAG